MNNRDYLNKLLYLCTDKQKNIFGRMYPGREPSDRRLPWAITQVENTLKNLNATKEDLFFAKRENAERVEKLEYRIKERENVISALELELALQKGVNDRLKNPISTKNNDVQERLMLLDALESLGVKNWEGYDEAISVYLLQ